MLWKLAEDASVEEVGREMHQAWFMCHRGTSKSERQRFGKL